MGIPMQSTLKHSLAHQTHILALNCLYLDSSIRYSNGWQVRSLKALRKGIRDLQTVGEALTDSHEALSLGIRYKICDCIFIISGYTQLFLEQCESELKDDARLYLKMTLVIMQSLEEVIETRATSRTYARVSARQPSLDQGYKSNQDPSIPLLKNHS